MQIIFDDFNKIPGKITFNAKSYDDEENLLKNDKLYFYLSEDIIVNDNLIAIALCTLCKNLYDKIYIDLILNEKVVEDIASYTNSIVEVKLLNNEPFIDKYNENISLNFSGGFDSLAAKILLDDFIEIVAINFSSSTFQREYDFFKKFKPYTVTTNFRELGYSNEKNDWTFIGVASILFSSFLNLKYQVFGTIFEGSHYHAIPEYSLREKYISPPFNYAGISDLKIIQGLTEIGTALVLCNTQPYLINDSLVSLSHPGSEKRYRKQLIIQTLKKKYGFKDVYIELTEPQPIEKVRSWGSNFALDFLTLYFLKFAGFEETSKTVKDIPQEVINFVNTHSLDFYEKYDTNFLNNIPPNIKSKFIINLTNCGINPFNENDFKELEEVMSLLKKYYTHLI